MRESAWDLFAAHLNSALNSVQFMRLDPCVYCGMPPGLQLNTLDHIQPRSKRGKGDWSNRAPACASCNIQKGSRRLIWFLIRKRVQ